jgi:ABC-2 type transport system ATP-binding protein
MISKDESKITNSQSAVLLAEELRKFYKSREALRGLSFTLKAGRVLGFLGPNGAGKTTAIRILTTIMEPTSGYFFVDGISSEYPEKIRRRIGVLPESLGFPKQITGIEFLIYFGQLYGRSAADARKYAQRLLEEVGLEKRAKSLIGSYSRGMRQRLGIARALVNDPVVVFLDEPTLGLDPRGQQDLLALIQRIARERNAGVVLCSHHLSDIEGVCDDVVILMSGQVIANGTVAEVIGQAQQNAIKVHVPPQSIADARQALEAMPDIKAVTPAGEMSGWLGVELNGILPEGEHINNKILNTLIRAEIPILSFEAEGGRLQDVFLNLTEEATE